MGSSIMIPPVLNCNLKCRNCGHASPYIEKTSIDIETTLKSIDILIKTVGLTNIRMSGGEPLLFEQIIEFLSLLKKRKLIIRLVTNGILLENFWPSIKNYVDAIIVSDIGINREKIPKEIQKDIIWRIPGEFKKIFAPEGNPDPINSFERCTTHIKCACVFNKYLYPCPQALFFPKAMNKTPKDRILIQNDAAFKKKHNLLISKNMEVFTCKYCLGNRE